LKFVKFAYELKNMLAHIFRLEVKATFSPLEAPAQIKCDAGHTSCSRRKTCARECNETRRGMKQKLLEDKIVVVTGASRGIGKGIATQLGK